MNSTQVGVLLSSVFNYGECSALIVELEKGQQIKIINCGK